MFDIDETKDMAMSGVRKTATPKTAWMVLGASAGLLIGVMAMSALLGDQPSLLTRFTQPTTVEQTVQNGNGGQF